MGGKHERVLSRCVWREEEIPFSNLRHGAPRGIGHRGFEEGRLVVWNVMGRRLAPFAGHPRFRYCALSPDSSWLVSVSSDGSLKISGRGKFSDRTETRLFR